jgi:hypothetical protein
MFRYEGNAKGPAGSFTTSQHAEVSNTVGYKVGYTVG